MFHHKINDVASLSAPETLEYIFTGRYHEARCFSPGEVGQHPEKFSARLFQLCVLTNKKQLYQGPNIFIFKISHFLFIFFAFTFSPVHSLFFFTNFFWQSSGHTGVVRTTPVAYFAGFCSFLCQFYSYFFLSSISTRTFLSRSASRSTSVPAMALISEDPSSFLMPSGIAFINSTWVFGHVNHRVQ